MNRITDHKGNVFRSLTALCDFYNISMANFRWRYNNGWTMRDILETPIKQIKKNPDSIKRKIDDAGLSRYASQVYYLIRSGISVTESIDIIRKKHEE